MRLKKPILFAALSLVLASISFRALSNPAFQGVSAFVDTGAFDAKWTGDYYSEPAEESDSAGFRDFEEKRRHYLDSREIDLEEVEEDEVPQAAPSPRPSPNPPWLGTYTFPWQTPYFPFRPASSPTNPGLPAPISPQALYYYNRGSLENASQLEDEGRGFIRVFRDRDEEIGGRGWGTRAIIDLIRSTAATFAELHPGYERLQVADIARKGGGSTNHGSHQNGLDADIVFLRRDHREQNPFGGYGKNGFAEQFVIRTSGLRTIRTIQGKPKSVKVYTVKPSANFDTEANLNLLRSFQRSGLLKTIFIDKVLIRELIRYVENNKMTTDPEIEALMMKVEHAPSHTDHFHIRLFCQINDSKCVSANAPVRVRLPSKKKGYRKK